MIELTTKVYVANVDARKITDFVLRAGDDAYRRWWPGTHLAFHTVRRQPGDVGNLVYFDELVEDRRLAMHGIVREAVPGKRVVWQLKRGVPLPAWLVLELEEHAGGVTVTHALRAGFRGVWRFLDPLLNLCLTPAFRASMAEHARTEFRRLGELLHAGT